MRCCDDDGPVVDEESVSCSDLKDWSTEFESLTGRVASLFVHPKSRAHSRRYLEGLLAPIERKNGWTIAEYVGEKEPKATQRFLNLTAWDADDLRDLNLDYVIENLGDPGGVLIADPTGFAKKGRKSAGVQRQYSGTLGRIDNCQIGTFLAFVNSAGATCSSIASSTFPSTPGSVTGPAVPRPRSPPTWSSPPDPHRSST